MLGKSKHDDRGEYLNVCVLKPPRELVSSTFCTISTELSIYKNKLDKAVNCITNGKLLVSGTVNIY